MLNSMPDLFIFYPVKELFIPVGDNIFILIKQEIVNFEAEFTGLTLIFVYPVRTCRNVNILNV